MKYIYEILDLEKSETKTLTSEKYYKVGEIVELKFGKYLHECKILNIQGNDLEQKIESLIEQYHKYLHADNRKNNHPLSDLYAKGHHDCLLSVIHDLEEIIQCQN